MGYCSVVWSHSEAYSSMLDRFARSWGRIGQCLEERSLGGQLLLVCGLSKVHILTFTIILRPHESVMVAVV